MTTTSLFNGIGGMNDIIEKREERISSLEIATITGKQHKNVMRDIRNMEPAWEKINGLKFELVEFEDKKGQRRPCYSLTKTECLYVSTKFNDEARARLVLRWEELEQAERQRINELLHRNDDCLDYYRNVMTSEDTLTVRQIAFQLGMTAQELNKILRLKGIQYGQSGSYIPSAPYARKGYCKSRTYMSHHENGEVHTQHRTTWTEPGVEFIFALINEWRREQMPKIKVTQLTFEFN